MTSRKLLVFKIGTNGEMIHCPEISVSGNTPEELQQSLQLYLQFCLKEGLTPTPETETAYIVVPGVVFTPD